MKLKDLKVGDVVYIREDVNDPEKEWANRYDELRLTGVQQIFKVYYENEYFEIIGELGKTWVYRNHYTAEMIDWGKTRDLKINENWESIKKEISGDGTFEKITQFVENSKEKTVALTNNGEEFAVTNNDEENDIEKAVMMLMLKSIGITYGDVKKEVEKVEYKWKPIAGEQFYYISTTPALKVRAVTYFTDGALKDMTDVGNCFRTIEEAEEKLEKVKEILKGEE